MAAHTQADLNLVGFTLLHFTDGVFCILKVRGHPALSKSVGAISPIALIVTLCPSHFGNSPNI